MRNDTDDTTMRAAFEAWAAVEWDGKSIPDNAWLGFRGAWALSAEREREACARLMDLKRADLRLMAAEMTAQEMRTVLAVLTNRATVIRRRAGVTEGLPAEQNSQGTA